MRIIDFTLYPDHTKKVIVSLIQDLFYAEMQFILSWVIHHVNSISKAEIANIFGASDQNGDRYMDFINKAKFFESVCKIGSKVDGIRDLPFFELMEKDERFNKE